MNKLNKNLNLILITGIASAAFFTWISPKVLSLLFTPPVSFGTNCEPAAAWSMQKLVWTQFIGLGLGMLAATVFVSTRKSKAQLNDQARPANA